LLDSDHAKIEEPNDSDLDDTELIRRLLMEERKRKLKIEDRIAKMEKRMSNIEYGEFDYHIPLEPTSYTSFSTHGNIKKTKYVRRGSVDIPRSTEPSRRSERQVSVGSSPYQDDSKKRKREDQVDIDEQSPTKKTT